LLTAALAEFLPNLPIGGVAAGLHLMLHLPAGTDERTVVAAAATRSIHVFGASRYRARPRETAPALVIGYGGVSEPLIREGVQQLAKVIQRRGR